MTATSVQPPAKRRSDGRRAVRDHGHRAAHDSSSRSAGDPTVLWRDRLLLALLVLTATTNIGQAAGLGPAAVRMTGLMLLRVVLDGAFLALVLRLLRRPDLSPPARRFWTATGPAGLMLLAADGVQAGAVLRSPTSYPPAAPTAYLLLLGAGGLCVVAAMTTHPVVVAHRPLLRYRLDAATVVTTAGMVVWYTLFSERAHAVNPIVAVAGGGLAVAYMLGVARLMLAGAPPLTGLCGAAGALAAAAVTAGAVSPGLAVTIGLLPHALLVAAPRILDEQLRADPERLARPLRAAHPLVLGSIALAQFMLVVAVVHGDLGARGGGVVLGTLAVTALVLGRHLVGLRDQAEMRIAVDAGAEAVRRQEHRWAALAQHAADITCVLDETGSLRYASPAIERVLGYAPTSATGRRITETVHPEDAGLLHRTFADLLAAPGVSRSADVRMQCADGSWRWIRAVGTNLLDDPEVAGIVCNARDVTDALRFSEQLRYEETHDPLTRLANRALFAEQMRVGGAVSRGTVRESMSIVVLDLDRFTEINDTLGHAAGDAVLSAVAGRLLRCSRSLDTVARMGGDEFAVLLPATTAANGAVVARRICDAFAAPVVADGHELVVAISVGVSTGPVDQGDAVLRAANRAMRAAKHDRTGSFVTMAADQ